MVSSFHRYNYNNFSENKARKKVFFFLNLILKQILFERNKMIVVTYSVMFISCIDENFALHGTIRPLAFIKQDR